MIDSWHWLLIGRACVRVRPGYHGSTPRSDSDSKWRHHREVEVFVREMLWLDFWTEGESGDALPNFISSLWFRRLTTSGCSELRTSQVPAAVCSKPQWTLLRTWVQRQVTFPTLLFPRCLIFRLSVYYSLILYYTQSLMHWAQKQSVVVLWVHRSCCPESLSCSRLERKLRGVVPPHPSFPALLFQLQSAELLLPALLSVPQLLTVLVHAQTVGPHRVQVLVAPVLRQPRVPESRQRRRRARARGHG